MQQLALENNVVNRDVSLLYPVFASLVQAAILEASANGLRCAIFEGFRTPARQEWLYAKGRFGSSEKIVTNATARNSWHQYGLAVDIVFKDVKGAWTWEGNWDMLEKIMVSYGIEKGPKFEHAHFELTGGLTTVVAKGVAQSLGLQRVWLEVASTLGNVGNV